MRRPLSASAAWLTFAAGTLVGAPGAAQPPEDEETTVARLEYAAPVGQGCLDAAALALAVEAQLERRVFDEARAEVVVSGTARRTDEGWVAELLLRRTDGTQIGMRELRTPSPECSALDEGLPLVVALMVDLPRSRIALTLPQRPPPAAAPAAPPPAPRRSRRALGFHLRAGALVA